MKIAKLLSLQTILSLIHFNYCFSFKNIPVVAWATRLQRVLSTDIWHFVRRSAF